jgi:hypothetical protein
MRVRYGLYRTYDDRDLAFYAWLGVTLALAAVYLTGWLPFLGFR